MAAGRKKGSGPTDNSGAPPHPGKLKASQARARSHQKFAGIVVVIAVLIAVVARNSAQDASSPNSNNDDHQVALDLIAHLRKQGASIAVKPTTFSGGLRGVAAERDFKPGAMVMSLPLNELLFEDTVAPEVRKACAELPCNVSRALIALGLAYERQLGDKSRFSAFIKTLPEDLTNLVAWPTPLLKLMEKAMPGARSYLSHEMYELKGANALLPSPIDINKLIWAIAMVQSRAFNMWGGRDVLIPGGGLFNHHWNPDLAIPMPTCDTNVRQCHVKTGRRAVKKGQQLFFHYRPWSNLQLLIRYGFAVPGNPWGPALTFGPLIEPPDWLIKAGCSKGPILLQRQSGGKAPLPAHVLQCAHAAFVANQSEASSKEAEAMWTAGAFTKGVHQNDSHGQESLSAIASACEEAARKWTDPEGLEILKEAAAVQWYIAKEVVRSVQHDLELLQACQSNFGGSTSNAATAGS